MLLKGNRLGGDRVSERTYQDLGEDPSLLLVDDDDPFLKRLAKAMEKRGFEVETAGSVAAGREALDLSILLTLISSQKRLTSAL